MKDKYKYNTSQLFNFAQNSYLERTSRPVYAMAFLLPFIVFYELGTIFINTNVLRQYWQGRVVAFSWLQKFLEYVGFSSKFAWVATPFAVIVILAALQLASRKRWRFWFGDIWPMVVECVLLAVPLIVLGLFLNSPAAPEVGADQIGGSAIRIQTGTVAICSSAANDASPPAPNPGAQTIRLLADIVTGIGAGIYEELVFRLVLICLLMLLFQDALRLSHSNSIILSVLISAALFSAYHHVDFFSGQLYQTTRFDWTQFGFRTIAGVYFAVLFAIRGFGITAGTHAFYDVIATLINAFFFTGGN
ncbi:MAG TPA: CPBP family intramembrane glutamic endopeptidase [Sedimentisphaerales bacterium]|nr:CPBP family intramembrane glutamic endopeptidase [Sedimentisphaerales bacterium]